MCSSSQPAAVLFFPAPNLPDFSPPLKSPAAGIRGGSFLFNVIERDCLKTCRHHKFWALVRETAGYFVRGMAGDLLLRNKWWPVRDGFFSTETAIVADVNIPSGVCSLPIVSSLNLRRFLSEKPVKVVLKVSKDL